MNNAAEGGEDDDDEEGVSSREMTPVPSLSTVNGMNGAGSGDDDPVIAEIPVFLSKGTPNDNLYLFQYPVRPANMPYSREAIQGKRWWQLHQDEVFSSPYRKYSNIQPLVPKMFDSFLLGHTSTFTCIHSYLFV